MERKAYTGCQRYRSSGRCSCSQPFNLQAPHPLHVLIQQNLLTPNSFCCPSTTASRCTTAVSAPTVKRTPPPRHVSTTDKKSPPPHPLACASMLLSCSHTPSDEVPRRDHHRCQGLSKQGSGYRQEADVVGRRSGDASVAAATTALFPPFPRHDGVGRHA